MAHGLSRQAEAVKKFGSGVRATKHEMAAILGLEQEDRIISLLKDAGDKRFEASGICLKDGWLHIVFDDEPRLLRCRADWRNEGDEPVLLDLDGTGKGYEDITYQSSAGRWYCLIEATGTGSGAWMPRIDEFDESFGFIGSSWLDFPIRSGNKGFEGLSILRSGGYYYLLGLCEGNNCKSGSAGKKPGRGRIQVFRQASGTWEHTGTIKLPEPVRFRDFSGLDIYHGSLAVISQASSAMWLGRLHRDPVGREDPFQDDGRQYFFPRDGKGRIVYGNVEGVAWLSDNRVAVVSDKAKAGQPKRTARKDQSVHIFRLPDAGLPGGPGELNR